jgi:cytochrome P450
MQKFGRVPPGTKVYNILNAPDNIHARQRKMLSHAFSDRAVSALIKLSTGLEY